MEQGVGVPGAQNEPFFELLHPSAVQTPSPPDISGDATSPPPSPPGEPAAAPGQSIPPSYEFQLTRFKSMDVVAKPDEGRKVQDPPPSLYRPPSASSSEKHHTHHVVPQGIAAYSVTELDYERPVEARDEVTMAAINSTMKSYADSVLHVLGTTSGKLSQLETTVQGLEHSVAGLKSGEWERQEQSNSRLTQLERLIDQARTGLQLIHDKPVVAETTPPSGTPPPLAEPQPPAEGLQLPKVGGSNEELPPHVAYAEHAPHFQPQYPLQGPLAVHSHYAPQGPPPPPQQVQPFSASPHGPFPSMKGPGKTSCQPPYPPPVQGNAQAPPPPPLQQPPSSQHSMSMTSFHSPPPPPLPLAQTQYAAETYSQMPPSHHHPGPHTSAPIYLPEAPQYPLVAGHGGPWQQPLPQEVLHPSLQHVLGGSPHRYDPAMGRGALPPSNMSPSYLPKPAPSVSLYETSSGSRYGAPPYKAGQPIPSAPVGAAGSHPRLPTAAPVHAAVLSGPPPTAHSAQDEVFGKVVAMGFSRGQVLSVMHQLTQNGQSVDLNMVLERLMNGGESPQPPRGWFGRGY